MIDRILKAVSEIPDHVTAIFLIVLGAGVSIVHGQHDTGQALIAAGFLLITRGTTTDPEILIYTQMMDGGLSGGLCTRFP